MILNQTIELVNNTPDYTWISSVITLIITMLTIYFTNRTTRIQIKSEIENYQKTQQIKSNENLLKDVVMMLRLKDLNDQEQKELMKRIVNGITIFGTQKSISIFSAFQQFNYKEQKTEEDMYKPMAYAVLLISQIKYDTTGDVVSPLEFLKITINDYETNKNLKECLIPEIKAIVKKLDLNKDFAN